ncbi:MAG: methyltransferase [Deltaproteobacteria bacterium]|nr:methyltransferase [Deltaproteobacteria bacterium]
MSATGRRRATGPVHVRDAQDSYATPSAVTQALLEVIDLRAGARVLEPAVGDGKIVDELLAHGPLDVTAIELDASRLQHVAKKCRALHADFLALRSEAGLTDFDFVITNPPYRLATEFIEHARAFVHPTGAIAMLLRLNFLGSRKRAEFLREFYPDIYVITPRSSFTGGGTDATEYAWFVWPGGGSHFPGVCRPLLTAQAPSVHGDER